MIDFLLITILYHWIFQEGGIRALYRGFWPTIIGMIPYAGFSFYSFEKLKYLCMKHAPNYFCEKYDRNTGMTNLKFV